MSTPKSFVPDKPNGITLPSSFVSDPESKPDVSALDMGQVAQLKASSGVGGIRGFGTGVAKAGLSTIFGAGKIGTKIGRALLPKFAEPKEPTFFEKEKPIIAGKEIELEPIGGAEKIGFGAEQIAEFAVPATKVAKVTIGANFLTKLVSRIIPSATVATAQAGEVGKETAIAAGVETAIPVVGKAIKPVFNVVKRLFKGLGSGLSGVSTDVIDTIIKNPNKALEVSKQLEQSGNFSILENNARTIVNGVSKIKQEARKAFGEAVQTLKAEDIDPTTFRSSVQSFLDKAGSFVKGQLRTLKNVEFDDPKNIQKASNLIDDISTTKLDGFSLRKVLNKISESRFKIATTDERLSFNAFIKNMEGAVKTAINDSTDKLKEINKAFSIDMQLAEGIERIFGKIKFKSLAEVDKVAQKLESLFGQKGLNPRDIDNFLTRVGVSPEEFRVTEAVRQITGKITGANIKGLSVAELIQQVTSAIVPPKAIKNISILTGLAEPAVKSLFEKLGPTARGSLIELLIED